MRIWDDDQELAPPKAKDRSRRRGSTKRRAAVDDLHELAADLEIQGYQRMEVNDLIRAIRDRM
jgi:hypothetical protein